ncbi:hypothetical protein AB0I55_08575 [Actinocatenispora sera]|jgi:hypothetical protein|uniref:hypothetical protein n=1 Tax=Actinocatenispora sera TaxID=390989 RepID=UPI0033FFD0F7
MTARDALAGALLVNAVPHAIMGIAGKRCMTPLRGPESGPAANLAWSALNLAGGVTLLATGWRGIDQRTADSRLGWVTVGAFAMTAFGVGYELSRRLRRETA